MSLSRSFVNFRKEFSTGINRRDGGEAIKLRVVLMAKKNIIPHLRPVRRLLFVGALLYSSTQ